MKLMKKNHTALLLLCLLTQTTSSYCNNASYCSKAKRITIDHGVIKLVDGTAKIKFSKMLRLVNDITNLRTKDSVPYHGNNYSVSQLANKEHKNALSGIGIEQALENAVDQFRSFSADYLNEARGFKSQMQSLISAWAKQRNIEHSILLNWSKQPANKELEEFKKSVTSFNALDEFLDHLSCFLLDLMESCKISKAEWSDYINKLKNQKGKRV